MSMRVEFSVLLIINVLFCECSNVYHESSKIVYRPDDASEYFGYSVSLSKQRLIVGAPKARSRLRRISSGQVFRCPAHDLDTNHNVTCLPIGVSEEIEDRIFARSFAREDLFKDGMWFGAAVSATPNGAAFICAPRWTTPYKDTHLLQNGMCFMLASRMAKEYLPLVDRSRQAFLSDEQRSEYGEFGTHLNYYAYGQAGFSVKVSESSVILGAPGLVQWTGGVVEYRPIDKNFKNSYLSKQTTINSYYTKEVGPDEYLGYSVESGVFDKNGTNLIVAGAPRSHFGYGQVLIFEPSIRENSPLNIKYKVVGDQLGAYFGATLCCTDINGDGVVDLMVGAPNYVRKDGVLHYDQGAVYVYLTNTQETHFSLEARGYISGSEVSGARFGSSIADLGDIDGDGFNDIAVGAPWDDDGKGAVYIYRGGRNGLNKQYVQRIAVEDSRTFGYSISKGVDMDENNCSDLAVGAYNVSEAYIFRCIPTVFVSVSIIVPDAVNLPVNATNFTALFCVNSTPRTTIKNKAEWLMQLGFTARITIDTKENRASFNGDTEYDLYIAAGNENCDEKIVMVKPTADLSRPISIKFYLEDNGSLEDSQKFPQNAARLSADSVLQTSFDIQLRRDCGEDLICKPLLHMSLEPLSSTYVPGTNDTLGFRVSILNSEEPSYGAKVHLTLPSPPKRLPSECSLDDLVVTCHLPAPLSRSESVEWEIELEYTYRDSVAKELKVVANLEDPLYDGTDIERKRRDIAILIKPEAKLAVTGKALPNATVAVTRDKFSERGNMTLVHYFEVTNFGPSDWFRLPVQILLPEKTNLSSQIKGCQELGPSLECTWDLPALVSMPIVLPLRFDMGLYGKLLQDNSQFNITTKVVINLEAQNKTEHITTTLVLEPAPPIWPYVVGGIAGIILLAVMILVFHKYGFFSRNRPGNFNRLKDQETDEASSSGTTLEETRSTDTAEESVSGADEPTFLTETSSRGLLADNAT
ncbi:integrin alpha-V isoform X1 [Bicyclus anynana]|uniref:Integrin alpha-V isoform X1 n=1 Tax=Bicyclus anynana TaxID=110368 RepID=A0A6J1PBA5_BICAN|nr:integrin alpha-V isoform X1 [Bicyclus anynana]